MSAYPPTGDIRVAPFVACALLHRHPRRSFLGYQLLRRLYDPPPRRVAVQAAELAAFRCVDPVKADVLAVHLNGIAVDHVGDAGHIGQGRGGEQAQGRLRIY